MAGFHARCVMRMGWDTGYHSLPRPVTYLSIVYVDREIISYMH